MSEAVIPEVIDTATYVDLTSADPYEMARLWGTQPAQCFGGVLAVLIKEPSFIRNARTSLKELGEPGDVLLVHNQRMQRIIVAGDVFDFVYGEKL